MEESRWLREHVEDEELSLLFTAVGDDLRRAIEYVMDRAARRSAVERSLLELLELAVNENLDDTYGSVWISLILGELQCRNAIPIFLRALGSGDEVLRDAAVDALRRIGEPAFDAVMKALEENREEEFELACYAALEGAGAWEHPYLLEEIRDFLLERIRNSELSAPALEAAALALARLGDRRAIEPIRSLLVERFGNINPALRDAVEMLEENREGIPLPSRLSSWEDRLEWITGEAFDVVPRGRKNAKPKRRRPSTPFTA